MQQVFERIWVGSERDCRPGDCEWAVVHACKSPCHQQAVGYRGNLPSSHPHYLSLTRGHDLFLNLIDPPIPLFKLDSFVAFLDFADTHWLAGRTLLIHCNQGESRAPSLVLLFLAKRRAVLDAGSYQGARKEFEALCPDYRPGAGIVAYLSENWGRLGTTPAKTSV